MTTKFHAIAAAAALVAVGSAQALTPTQIAAARTAGTLQEIRIAGASALRLSVAAYAKEICTPSTFHVIWNSNAEGTGYRAYACNLDLKVGNYNAGTPVLLYKRDTGGSGQGVNPIALAADQTHMRVVDDATCTPINGGATPAVDAAIPNFICTGTETAGIKSDAGISDVEPALLQAVQNLPSGSVALSSTQLSGLDVAPLAQALFGVVVNKKAYRALQEAQGIIAPGAALIDVPADQSTWTDATLATIPSLPSSFVGAALTGALVGGAANNNAVSGFRGWNIVIPTTVDANVVTKTLNICRRTEGSGTQAVTNAFFAGNPCLGAVARTPVGVSGSSGNEATTSATVTSAPIVVQEGTSAGQVENCVGKDAESAVGGDNTAYALGVLGREANPQRGAVGSDLQYRYVKLDGVAPVRSQARVGNYGFVYEATMQWNRATVPNGSDKALFLSALRSGFGSPNALAAVDSDTQQGVMTPPAAYTGPFATATGNAALFGSRVARTNAASCATLRMVK